MSLDQVKENILSRFESRFGYLPFFEGFSDQMHDSLEYWRLVTSATKTGDLAPLNQYFYGNIDRDNLV